MSVREAGESGIPKKLQTSWLRDDCKLYLQSCCAQSTGTAEEREGNTKERENLQGAGGLDERPRCGRRHLASPGTTPAQQIIPYRMYRYFVLIAIPDRSTAQDETETISTDRDRDRDRPAQDPGAPTAVILDRLWLSVALVTKGPQAIETSVGV